MQMLLKSSNKESTISKLYESGFDPKSGKGYDYYDYMTKVGDDRDKFKIDYPEESSLERSKLSKFVQSEVFLEKLYAPYFLAKTDNDIIYPLGSNAYGISVKKYIEYDKFKEIGAPVSYKPESIFSSGNYRTPVSTESKEKVAYPYSIDKKNYYKEFPFHWKGLSSFCSVHKNLIDATVSGVHTYETVTQINNSKMFISDKIFNLSKNTDIVSLDSVVTAKLGSKELEPGDYIFSFFCKTKKDFTVRINNSEFKASEFLKKGYYERFVGCFSLTAKATVNFFIDYVGPIQIAGVYLESPSDGELFKSMPSPYYKEYIDTKSDRNFDRKSPLAFSNPLKQEGNLVVINFKREVDDQNKDFTAKEWVYGYEVSTQNPRRFENVFLVVDSSGINRCFRFDEKGDLITDTVTVKNNQNHPIKVKSKDNIECNIDIILGGSDLENSYPGYYRDLIVYNSLNEVSLDSIKLKLLSLLEVPIIKRGNKDITAIKSPLIFEGVDN